MITREEMLDLTSFKKSLDNLEKLIIATNNVVLTQDLGITLQEGLKAGVIQNFEVTYELSWKFIKRWLEQNIGNSYVDGVSRRELFRLAAESLLISDVDKWMKYHKGRNETSHTYDALTAEDVYQLAMDFVHDAKQLFMNLEERND
mgnify:CR=1 FL=1